MNGRCRRKLPPGLIQEDNRKRARNGRRRGASPREVCDSRDSSVRITSQVIGRLFDDHAFVTFAASTLGGTSDSAASGRVENSKSVRSSQPSLQGRRRRSVRRRQRQTPANLGRERRSEEHTSELQSLLRISYAV